MSANLLNQALGFISSLFVVRFLKPEELGESRVIGTYVGYVQLLGSLGLASSILTYIPRSNDPGVRRHWLQVTLLATSVMTAVFAMVGGWLSWRGWLMSNEHTGYWFRWALLGGLASSATGILISFYQAERAVRELAGIQTAVRVLALLISVGGAWLGGFEGYIIAGIVSSFLMFGSLAGSRRGDQAPVRRLPLPAGYVQVAGISLLATLLWTAGRTADLVILDRLVTDRAKFGCYSLALSIATIMSLVNSTVQVVTVPFFSARHQAGDWILRNAFKWQVAGALVTLLAAGSVICGAALLIRPIYGPAYAAAISLLIPLVLAQCLLATFHILAGALLGMGLVRVNTTVAAIVVPVSIFISYTMARRYGIVGTAWGQVISATIYAAIQSCWGWSALCRHARMSVPRL